MNKKGLIKKIATGKTPADICQYALDHILGWTDPIDGICLLASCKIDEIFILDTFPAELQTHRMVMGNFYHYLMLELMQLTSRRAKSPMK